ncbi:amidohydrolase family protein [Fodinicurvata sp. EGI_FJ10296]|uniref:amidohydrolase family protein n=1 Tax=Fodinicurvata sp. EGI_FJ10296 TaxID=3231908 RepID=UPI0034531FB5
MTTRKVQGILRNGTVVDPVNGINRTADLVFDDGRIVERDPSESISATHDIDAAGLLVVPGIIDIHVHASPWLGGRHAHRMLASAGITTALEMAGPIDGMVDFAGKFGAGLNMACINYVRPGHTVRDTDPGEDELRDLLASSLDSGAIGLKLLGGHFPLTPDASAATIKVAAEAGAYVAFHAGTLESGSHIDGMLEACALAAGNPLHLPHINSYTRGQKRDAMAEGELALTTLLQHPNIWSESYLSPINATSAKCSNGAPESLTTRTWLEKGGYAPDEAGLETALRNGWAQLNLETDDAVVLATGDDAVAAWRAADTKLGVSFAVNPSEPRLRLATARDPDRGFVVDALATDGGGIPRNVIIDMGLSLVRLEAISIDDFVIKSSATPARILGLPDKGHLGAGADADITIIDFDRQRPVSSFVGGEPVLLDGKIVGKGTRLITTPRGRKVVSERGIEGPIVPLGTMLPKRRTATA